MSVLFCVLIFIIHLGHGRTIPIFQPPQPQGRDIPGGVRGIPYCENSCGSSSHSPFKLVRNGPHCKRSVQQQPKRAGTSRHTALPTLSDSPCMELFKDVGGVTTQKSWEELRISSPSPFSLLLHGPLAIAPCRESLKGKSRMFQLLFFNMGITSTPTSGRILG